MCSQRWVQWRGLRPDRGQNVSAGARIPEMVQRIEIWKGSSRRVWWFARLRL